MKIPDTMKHTGAASPFTGTPKPGQMKSGRPKSKQWCRRGQEEERGEQREASRRWKGP